MHTTNTKQLIANYIHKQGATSIKQLIKYFGLHKTMIHRHIKHLVEENTILKHGSSPTTQYIHADTLNHQLTPLAKDYLRDTHADSADTSTKITRIIQFGTLKQRKTMRTMTPQSFLNSIIHTHRDQFDSKTQHFLNVVLGLHLPLATFQNHARQHLVPTRDLG